MVKVNQSMHLRTPPLRVHAMLQAPTSLSSKRSCGSLPLALQMGLRAPPRKDTLPEKGPVRH